MHQLAEQIKLEWNEGVVASSNLPRVRMNVLLDRRRHLLLCCAVPIPNLRKCVCQPILNLASHLRMKETRGGVRRGAECTTFNIEKNGTLRQCRSQIFLNLSDVCQKSVRKRSELCQIFVRNLSDSNICHNSVRKDLEMPQKCI